MNTVIVSAFSAKMLPRVTLNMTWRAISLDEARCLCSPEQKSLFDNIEPDTITSAIGHADTAAVFSDMLGIQVLCNRIFVKLQQGTRLLLGQYFGPMIPDGARELPNGAKIEWWLVTIE
jgi:hypothetical protein